MKKIFFLLLVSYNCHAQTPATQQHLIDSLRTQLFINKYKIEKVKYYLKIVKKKPSQQKFLVGWINRAVN